MIDPGVLLNNGVWIQRKIGIPESVLNGDIRPAKTRPSPKYKKLSAEEMAQHEAVVAERDAIRRATENARRESETARKRTQFEDNEILDEIVNEMIANQRAERETARIVAEEIRKAAPKKRRKSQTESEWNIEIVDGVKVFSLR